MKFETDRSEIWAVTELMFGKIDVKYKACEVEEMKYTKLEKWRLWSYGDEICKIKRTKFTKYMRVKFKLYGMEVGKNKSTNCSKL